MGQAAERLSCSPTEAQCPVVVEAAVAVVAGAGAAAVAAEAVEAAVQWAGEPSLVAKAKAAKARHGTRGGLVSKWVPKPLS